MDELKSENRNVVGVGIVFSDHLSCSAFSSYKTLRAYYYMHNAECEMIVNIDHFI